MADEQADVAAETAGRVIATPVERGTRVTTGTVLVRISGDRSGRAAARGGGQRRADRGASRAVRRPAVRSHSRAGSDEREGVARLGRSRIQSHQVAAGSEGRVAERVRPALDAGAGGAPAVSGGAERRAAVVPIAAWPRARASTSRARRPPTRRSARRSTASSRSGSSSTGDYVTRGTKVAAVVQIDPLRVELTVPEQYLSRVERAVSRSA